MPGVTVILLSMSQIVYYFSFNFYDHVKKQLYTSKIKSRTRQLG